MSKYSVIPGPTTVCDAVLSVFGQNFGSSDIEPEFWDDYFSLEKNLQTILSTTNDVVLSSGEGMVALWGGLKSILAPNDTVLSIINGLYGEGFASIAEKIGANVIRLTFSSTIDLSQVLKAITTYQPQVVTMVHCETPIGVLNSLQGIGTAVHDHNGLFLVDCVSSAGGVPILIDEMEIDVGLVGSQKVFSAPPILAFTSVSARAWEKINLVHYEGYDALLPFEKLHETRFLPYTHCWHAIAATKVATDLLIQEGLENVYQRHQTVQAFCIEKAQSMGIRLYDASLASPTCSAFWIPEEFSWEQLNQKLREKGVIVGGSYGEHAGKVFRIGRMGSQACMDLIGKVMQILNDILLLKRNV